MSRKLTLRAAWPLILVCLFACQRTKQLPGTVSQVATIASRLLKSKECKQLQSFSESVPACRYQIDGLVIFLSDYGTPHAQVILSGDSKLYSLAINPFVGCIGVAYGEGMISDPWKKSKVSTTFDVAYISVIDTDIYTKYDACAEVFQNSKLSPSR